MTSYIRHWGLTDSEILYETVSKLAQVKENGCWPEGCPRGPFAREHGRGSRLEPASEAHKGALQPGSHHLYCVPSRVWTVPSLCSWKFWKIQDNFDTDGQLMGPLSRSNPTARRGRNNLEFFKIFMNLGMEMSTLSMGHSIHLFYHAWATVSPVEIIDISICTGKGSRCTERRRESSYWPCTWRRFPTRLSYSCRTESFSTIEIQNRRMTMWSESTNRIWNYRNVGASVWKTWNFLYCVPSRVWHPRHLCHATFAHFEMISTTKGSWIRSGLRRDWIQLPVVVEIISQFPKRWRWGRVLEVTYLCHRWVAVVIRFTPCSVVSTEKSCHDSRTPFKNNCQNLSRQEIISRPNSPRHANLNASGCGNANDIVVIVVRALAARRGLLTDETSGGCTENRPRWRHRAGWLAGESVFRGTTAENVLAAPSNRQSGVSWDHFHLNPLSVNRSWPSLWKFWNFWNDFEVSSY